MTEQKKYTGTAYIGVVGPDHEYGECRDSIDAIQRRPGDAAPRFVRATKGYEARQLHFENWIKNTHHAFMLLLDHDMVFPRDTLERLRSHELPYLSGYYLHRSYAPMRQIWFKPWSGQWPFEPWTETPERGKLHPIGASGWGCILIHRDVVNQTLPLLKGEWVILEDDMDIWPYNLHRVMNAIRGLSELVESKPHHRTLRAALKDHVAVLEDEIRPLRGVKDQVGSDLRFPFYALHAGFQLFGDPDVRCGHELLYPLNPDDYDKGMNDEQKAKHAANMGKLVNEERARVLRAVNNLNEVLK